MPGILQRLLEVTAPRQELVWHMDLHITANYHFNTCFFFLGTNFSSSFTQESEKAHVDMISCCHFICRFGLVDDLNGSHRAFLQHKYITSSFVHGKTNSTWSHGVYLKRLSKNCMCLIVQRNSKQSCLSELGCLFPSGEMPPISKTEEKATHGASSCHRWFTGAQFSKFLGNLWQKKNTFYWGSLQKSPLTFTGWEITRRAGAIMRSHAEWSGAELWLICNSNKSKSKLIKSELQC